MPSGDGGRAWFPEMLIKLKKKWSSKWKNKGTRWPEVITFCQQMTTFREELKKEKGVKGARIWCPECNDYSEMGPPPISPRSMLYALKKENIIADDEFHVLDKSHFWREVVSDFSVHKEDLCETNFV